MEMSYQEFLWRLKMVHGDCICLKTGKQRESAVSGVFRLYQGYFGQGSEQDTFRLSPQHFGVSSARDIFRVLNAQPLSYFALPGTG